MLAQKKSNDTQMASKTKLIKGFKYISQIFDEGKEEEIQIGFPTDVKHVAHIGWDGGPSTDAPSWMKDFKSAPLAPPAAKKEEMPDIQWVSEDSKSKRAQKAAASSSSKDGSDSEASIRSKSGEKKERSRQPRKHHSLSAQQGSDSTDAAARNLPDIPKKSRRKKSKEEGGSTRSRTKASAAAASGAANSDTGTETGPVLPPTSTKKACDLSTNDGEN